MPAPRIARLMAALGTSALLLCAGSSLVRAHLGSTKYLRIEHTAEGLLVHAEIEAIDAAMQLGLGEEASFEAILAEQERLRLWLVEGIQVRVEDRPCAARAGAPELLERDRRPFIGVALRYRCARAEGEQIWLRDDTIFPEDRQHEAIVRTAFAGEASASVLRAGSRELIVSRSPGLEGLMGAFLWEGVLHFVTGYDHILFLLSLILSAGFIVRARGLRKALRDVTILVTAFTLGHSVTLITAALGYVVLPSRLVESAIALSILVVAAINISRPEGRAAMPWLAFGFGLIHGFGFSSVLAELGLPRQHTVASLLCFNVGIELAQLAFVAAALGPIAWAASRPFYRKGIVRGGSALIAILAAYWFIERAFDL